MLKEMRADRVFRDATEEYSQLKSALLSKSTEDWSDKHLQLSNKGKSILAIEDKMEEDSPNHTGKGQGKGKGKGNPHSNVSRKGENSEKEWNQKITANITCKFCNKRGHYEANCWSKFPGKNPNLENSSLGEKQKSRMPNLQKISPLMVKKL